MENTQVPCGFFKIPVRGLGSIATPAAGFASGNYRETRAPEPLYANHPPPLSLSLSLLSFPPLFFVAPGHRHSVNTIYSSS